MFTDDDLLNAIYDFEEVLRKDYFELLPQYVPEEDSSDSPTITIRIQFNLLVYFWTPESIDLIDIPIFHLTYAKMDVSYTPDTTTVENLAAIVYNRAAFLFNNAIADYGIFVASNGTLYSLLFFACVFIPTLDSSTNGNHIKSPRGGSEVLKINGQQVPSPQWWRKFSNISTVSMLAKVGKTNNSTSLLTR